MFKKLIVNLLASKKLIVTGCGALSAIIVPILNKKLGLGLSAEELTASLVTVITLVLGFVVAQATSDVKTGGATSGVVQAQSPAPTVPAPAPAPASLPPEIQVVVDALAKK